MTAPIPPPPITPSQAPPVEPRPPGRGISGGTCFGIVVLSVGFLCCGLLVFGPLAQTVLTVFESAGTVDGPMVTESHFYDSLTRHQYAQAYSDLAPGLTVQYSQADLAKVWQSFEKHAGVVSVNYYSAYVETGDQANAHGYVTLGSKGRQYVIKEVKMNKVGDRWQIVDAQPALIPNP